MLKETNLLNIKESFKTLFLAVKIEPLLDGLVIQHPFSNSPIVNTMEMGIINLLEKGKEKEHFNAWKNTIYTLIDESNSLMRLFLLVDKNWRLTALKYTKEDMSLKDFSEILSLSWIMAENPNGDANVSINILIKWFRQADKHILMEDDDYKIWENLPDELTLYRGISQHHNPKGLSWTKNIETAKWFKNRFNSPDNYMLKAVVKKEDMICYLNSRGEDEIVVDTRHIVSEKVSL